MFSMQSTDIESVARWRFPVHNSGNNPEGKLIAHIAQQKWQFSEDPWNQGGLTSYNSRRPSIDFSMVISSAYSMSLPTGIPIAMRVTLSPARRNCPER